jgi:hypothetical protein
MKASLPRLVAAQLLWLRRPLPLALAMGLAALPAGMAWLFRRQVLTAGQLFTGLLYFDECCLPLWMLVATSAAWTDGEPEHRPLLLAWPVRGWALALAKLAAAAAAYSVLAGVAAMGLGPLWSRVTGAGVDALPAGLLFSRAMLAGVTLGALAGVGCAVSGSWAGFGLGAVLWFLNLPDFTAVWLDRATRGVINLLALSRGSAVPLDVVNQRQLAVALLLVACALLTPMGARRARQRGPWR